MMNKYSRLIMILGFTALTYTINAQEKEPTDSTSQEIIIEDIELDVDGGYGYEDNKEEYEYDNKEYEGEEEDDDGNVVVEISIGKDRSDDSNFYTRWLTLGLGINPVHVDGDFDLPNSDLYNDFDLRIGKSTNVDLGIVQQKLNLVNHRLYLYTGLGLDINKYMFEDNFVIDPDADTWQTSWPVSFEEIETKKNRLTTTYLHIPLMLNFESNDRHYNSFHLSAGGFVGIRLGTNQKIKFKDKDDNFIDGDKKFKERDNFNLSTLSYGLKTEVGFGPINVYSKYHLNDIFDEQAADPLNNFSIGIMILPF